MSSPVPNSKPTVICKDGLDLVVVKNEGGYRLQSYRRRRADVLFEDAAVFKPATELFQQRYFTTVYDLIDALKLER